MASVLHLGFFQEGKLPPSFFSFNLFLTFVLPDQRGKQAGLVVYLHAAFLLRSAESQRFNAFSSRENQEGGKIINACQLNHSEYPGQKLSVWPFLHIYMRMQV